MVGTGAKTVAVISDPLSNIEAKPEQWLNKDFFKVEKIRSIAVTFPVATNSWKVTRDTETGAMETEPTPSPAKSWISSKTSGVSYALSSPSFKDVVPAGAKPEQRARTSRRWSRSTHSTISITRSKSARRPTTIIPGNA